MININGWICIRESFNEEGEDEKKLELIIQTIESKIRKELDCINEYYDLRTANGATYLNITVAHNRHGEHVIDFFKWISSIAIGSYGLLYVQDDEDFQRGNDNQFKVWRMRKGKVDELDDPFLSPIHPNIEE
jgi:repressor of nif and glnA expression